METSFYRLTRSNRLRILVKSNVRIVWEATQDISSSWFSIKMQIREPIFCNCESQIDVNLKHMYCSLERLQQTCAPLPTKYWQKIQIPSKESVFAVCLVQYVGTCGVSGIWGKPWHEGWNYAKQLSICSQMHLGYTDKVCNSVILIRDINLEDFFCLQFTNWIFRKIWEVQN